MALEFEYEKDLNTGSQPFICFENNSSLYNYYVSGEYTMDMSATANMGLYDDVNFANEDRHLTTKAVTKIGIKNFPGIGGIGFYKDAYSDESQILAPIHTRRTIVGTPTLDTIEVVDNKLHIVIIPPSNINYTCYRVIVRQDAFAFEYIMYKTEYFVDLPTVRGNYICYCIGYDELTGTISENSNELNLSIETGSSDWSPDSINMSDFNARLVAVENKIKEYHYDVST